jgi:hypothetical protein
MVRLPQCVAHGLVAAHDSGAAVHAVGSAVACGAPAAAGELVQSPSFVRPTVVAERWLVAAVIRSLIAVTALERHLAVFPGGSVDFQSVDLGDPWSNTLTSLNLLML